MSKYHHIENVTVEQGMLSLVIDGKPIQQSLQALSPVLALATSEQARVFEISPSGYGIHWPLLDEDISIDGVLGIVHGPGETQKVA